MFRDIPYGKHEVSDQDIEEVVSVLRSEFLTQGPKINEFEKNFSRYVGSKYAVAVSNGTSALHLCNLALDLKKGDKVISTPISFCATSNSVLYCEGDIEFCDINPETNLLDIIEVRKKIESSPKGTYKGIIVVDFAGSPINLEEYKKLADEYNLWIIEDACHSPGGYFCDSKGIKQNCGNGSYADLAIFSFHPVKHIAAGEGGMITTNNKNLYEKLLLLRSHGIKKEQNELTKNNPGWLYDMQVLGFNYRISDLNCALAISQLKRADNNMLKREIIAKKYFHALKDKNITMSYDPKNNGHALHLFIIQFKKRDELYSFLKQNKIHSQIHYIPIHTLTYYKNRYGIQSFPVSEKYYSQCLSLPIYPGLKQQEQDYIINKVISFIS